MLGNPETLYEMIQLVIEVIKDKDGFPGYMKEGSALYLDNGKYIAIQKDGRQIHGCTRKPILIDENFHHTVNEFVSSTGGIKEDYEREIKKFIELLEWAGVAEQVDASDLKSDGESRAGSNPASSIFEF